MRTLPLYRERYLLVVSQDHRFRDRTALDWHEIAGEHVCLLSIWMVIIAIAIFRDANSTPTFPRWVAYYNLYAALGMCPASLMGFFKTGPFAYHGVLASGSWRSISSFG